MSRIRPSGWDFPDIHFWKKAAEFLATPKFTWFLRLKAENEVRMLAIPAALYP